MNRYFPEVSDLAATLTGAGCTVDITSTVSAGDLGSGTFLEISRTLQVGYPNGSVSTVVEMHPDILMESGRGYVMRDGSRWRC